MNVGRNYTVYVGEKSLLFLNARSWNTIRHALFQINFLRLKKKGLGERHNIYNTSLYGHRQAKTSKQSATRFDLNFFRTLAVPHLTLVAFGLHGGRSVNG